MLYLSVCLSNHLAGLLIYLLEIYQVNTADWRYLYEEALRVAAGEQRATISI